MRTLTLSACYKQVFTKATLSNVPNIWSMFLSAILWITLLAFKMEQFTYFDNNLKTLKPTEVDMLPPKYVTASQVAMKTYWALNEVRQDGGKELWHPGWHGPIYWHLRHERTTFWNETDKICIAQQSNCQCTNERASCLKIYPELI